MLAHALITPAAGRPGSGTARMQVEAQRIVALNERILAENGVILAKDSRILDFGCGSGRHVREYLESGYRNVYGYDIEDHVAPGDPEEAARFRFAAEPGAPLPFPDDHFDFVYSYSVMEHVLDPERAFREIYSVMRPGGVSLLDFPSKWRPIEPHTYVPFGGAVRSYPYYLLWAALGVRNEFQAGLSARETARRNHAYAQTGIRYLGGRELKRLLEATFDRYSYQEVAFLKHSPGRARLLYGPLKAFPPLRGIFRFAHTRIVLVEKTAERGRR